MLGLVAVFFFDIFKIGTVNIDPFVTDILFYTQDDF